MTSAVAKGLSEQLQITLPWDEERSNVIVHIRKTRGMEIEEKDTRYEK